MTEEPPFLTGRLFCFTVLKMELNMSQITLDAASAAMLDATSAPSAFSREEALKEAIEQYAAYDRWFRARVEEGEQAWLDGRYVSNDDAKARSKARVEQILAAKGKLA